MATLGGGTIPPTTLLQSDEEEATRVGRGLDWLAGHSQDRPSKTKGP